MVLISISPITNDAEYLFIEPFESSLFPLNIFEIHPCCYVYHGLFLFIAG